MEKIKTIKEIVTSPTISGIVHFIGEVVTKEDASYGKGKHREERTLLLIKDGNFCIEATLSKKSLGGNYEKFVKEVKIGKICYFEGSLKKYSYLDEIEANITNVSQNFLLKKLEHEDETSEIRLLKYIYENKEEEAIKLIEDNKDIDVNYKFDGEVIVYFVLNNRMPNLFDKIVNHPKFDSSIEDGFGETLLGGMIYLFNSTDMKLPKYESDHNMLRGMIKSILKASNYDFNAKDINSETAIGIACEFPSMLWFVEEMLKKDNVDINIVDDIDYTALGNAIRNKNLEAIKLLSKRKDLIVREEDVQLAKDYDVNLEELGIDITHTTSYVLDKTAEKHKELVEACKA